MPWFIALPLAALLLLPPSHLLIRGRGRTLLSLKDARRQRSTFRLSATVAWQLADLLRGAAGAALLQRSIIPDSASVIWSTPLHLFGAIAGIVLLGGATFLQMHTWDDEAYHTPLGLALGCLLMLAPMGLAIGLGLFALTAALLLHNCVWAFVILLLAPVWADLIRQGSPSSWTFAAIPALTLLLSFVSARPLALPFRRRAAGRC